MSRAGDRLRALAVRIFDQRSMERIVDPLLADLQMEYADAIYRGLVWRSRWVLIRGYSAFLKTIALWQMEEILPASRAWTIDDREALSRTFRFSAAAGVIATVALALPPVMNAHPSVSNPRMFVYLVPQAIVLAVPIGFTLGVFLGLRGRTLSARSTRAVLTCAILCSGACLATFAWVIPSANQEFRRAVFVGLGGVPVATGVPVAKGLNELTLGELGERLASFRRTAVANQWFTR